TMTQATREKRQYKKSRKTDTNPRQPGATVSNARNFKRFLVGAEVPERISCWNHQIFCVNWGCFISPQGSHALCNGKIRQPDWGSNRRRHEDVSFSWGGIVLRGGAGAISARGADLSKQADPLHPALRSRRHHRHRRPPSRVSPDP